ncbi:hypothetical protein MACJ_003675 [Theileria orientalis]|uniref:Pre-mRNA-splicing factor SPF27 n=1 Tax=Theileria orientalis TaxID=68886 RepID=A0A976SLA5_THEOR|nr:hypothetical protein MACJ_003675 [Theileria orientalis]
MNSNVENVNDLLYKRNQYHHLVDSLPFVDTVPADLEHVIKDLVNDEMKLILEESGLSESQLLDRYLDPLPFNFTPNGCLYNKEIDRINNGAEMEKLDFSRYSPISSHKDFKTKMNRIKMLMEYSHDSLINLELMDRYKEGSWLKHLDSLTLLKLSMEKRKKDLDSKLNELNKRRKLSQIDTANQLRSINQEYEEYKLRLVH